MPNSTHRGFIDTELDPHLLSAPFRIETNWHVITGAPSCGKTTLIDQLAAKGYRTVPECAREYMEQEIAAGRKIEEIHAEGAALQNKILAMQLDVERGLPATEVVFLDGAVPGSLAWFRAFGMDPNEILPHCFHHRYASVFILDQLPQTQDGLRFRDGILPGYLERWFDRDYCALGYDPVRVPLLPPLERLDYVLERLPERGSR